MAMPIWISELQPALRGEVIGPGTAYSWRFRSGAHLAVFNAPDRGRACATTTEEANAAMSRLRSRNRWDSGMTSGHSSLISAPPCRRILSKRRRLRCGPM